MKPLKHWSTLAGQVISVAGTLLIAGPVFARQDDGLSELGRRSVNLSERLARQAVRLDRMEQRNLGRTQSPDRLVVPLMRSVNRPSIETPIASLRTNRKDGQSQFLNSNDKLRTITRGLELDLTSNNRSIILGENMFSDATSYVVRTGNEDKVVTSGSHVSPAEYVALQQVIEGGQQALVVDAEGRGVSGQFSIDNINSDGSRINAKSLVIPSSVNAIGSLSRSSDFRLTGELINNGNLLVDSSSIGISARDIHNLSDATISSAGDLTISAGRDLINDGSISSAGKLSVSAGRSIRNAGNLISHSNLEIQSTDVTNTGVISSSENITFSTSTESAISINSAGGKIVAAKDITVGNAASSGKIDTRIMGGELLSRNLKIYSGDGHVDVSVDDITGGVIVHAGAANINSSGDTLTINELVTTGDPLITGAGNVNLLAQATDGGPLSVIAGGNITLWGDLDTTNHLGFEGGDLVLIAGADFTVNANDVQVHGASSSGGDISWFNVPPVIRTSSALRDGGDVLIAVFSPSGGNSLGAQLMPIDINTSGGVGHTGGSVTIIAAGGVSVRNVDTVGVNNSAPGDLLFSGSEPIVVGTFTVDKTTGAVTGGSIVPGVGVGDGTVGVGNLQGRNVTVSGSVIGVQSVSASLALNLDSIGYINSGALSTPVLNLSLQSDTGTAWIDNASNSIGTVNATGSGIVYLVTDSNGFLLSNVGATQSLEATSLGTITIGADIATTGNVTFNTASIVNEYSLNANAIQIISPSGAMVIDGGSGGSFTATGVAEKVLIGTWLGSITLEGLLDFGSDAEITISSSANFFTVASQASVTGQHMLTVNAQNVNLLGSIAGSPLIFNYDFMGGTIINTQGDVVLSGPVIMNGGDLAILAAGNVIATGPLTINTSSTTGDAGNILIWAGVFSIPGITTIPGTPGQIVDSFVTFNPTASYLNLDGDVQLGNVDLNASSSNGNGGSVTVATTKGTIAIGNIDASGSISGGNIQIYGVGGATVASISSIGGSGGSGGDVDIRATGLTTSSTMQVLNGTVSGYPLIPQNGAPSGSVVVGPVSVGDGNVNVSGVNVVLSGAVSSKAVTLSATEKLTSSVITAILASVNARDIVLTGPVSLNNLSISASSTLDLSALTGGVTLQQDSVGNGGQMYLRADDIIYTSSSSNPFTLRADGSGSGSGGSITFLDVSDPTITYVGPTAKPKADSQFLEISAKSGTGFGANGGSILLSTGGDIIINTDGFSAAAQGAGPSNGAHYLIEAGGNLEDGELSITGDLRADGLNGGAGGSISLTSYSSKSFSINSTSIPKNGIAGVLSAQGAGGEIAVENIYGSIDVRTSAGLQAQTVKLYSGDGEKTKTSITTDKGAVISADLLVISVDGKSTKGNKTLTISAKELVAYSVGKGNIQNVGTDTLTVLSAQFNGGFSLLSSSSLVLSSMQMNGDIEIVSTNGSIAVSGDPVPSGASVINAINGDVTIRSTDVSAGSITLGQNAKIQTSDHGGDITIAVGDVPKKPKHSDWPFDVSVIEYGKGRAYLEPGSDVIDVQGNSVVVARNHDVLVSNSSSQKIVFEGGNGLLAEDNYYSGSSIVVSKSLVQTSDYSKRTSVDSGESLGGVFNNQVSPIKSLAVFPDTKTVLKKAGSLSGGLLEMQNASVYSSALPSDLIKLNNVSTVTSSTSHPSNIIASKNSDAMQVSVICDEDLGLDDSLMRRFSESRRCEAVRDEVSISTGVVLVAPSKDLTVKTAFGAVEVLKNAVAVIVVDDDRLAVYDLHDARKNSVKISTGRVSTTLSPGRCSILTKNVEHDFAVANPLKSVGYKSLCMNERGSGGHLFTAEFSIPAVVSVVPPLRRIVGSAHSNAKKLSSSLIKTNAVLLHLGNGEDYVVNAEPSMVASATRN